MKTAIENSRNARSGGGLLARLRADDRGALAVLVAVAIPILAGMAGLSMDAGSWYLKKRDLQTAADAAALAAGFQMAAGNEAGSMESAAQLDAERNGFNETGTGVLVMDTPPATGGYVGDEMAVQVTLTEDAPLYFSGMIVDAAAITVQARATAKVYVQADMCVVALDETASPALRVSGNAEFEMECGIASNSSASDAMKFNGNINVEATALWSAGGIDEIGNVDLQVDYKYENASKIEDPYADLAVPAFSGCDYNNEQINNGNVTLSPGVYCGGLRIQGNSDVQFEPGIYIMDRGDFTVTGNADVQGDNVSFVITSSTGSNYGAVSLVGNGDLHLNPPTTGDMAGVIFYADRNSPSSVTSDIGGTTDAEIEGVFYFPSQDLVFHGTGDVGEGCLKILANTVTVIGNVEVENECGDEVEEVVSTRVRLVE